MRRLHDKWTTNLVRAKANGARGIKGAELLEVQMQALGQGCVVRCPAGWLLEEASDTTGHQTSCNGPSSEGARGGLIILDAQPNLAHVGDVQRRSSSFCG